MEYQVDYDESNKKLLDPLTKDGNFNNWFNNKSIHYCHDDC